MEQGHGGLAAAEAQTAGEYAPIQEGDVKVRQPFKLVVNSGVSNETIACLDKLLEQAKAGRLIGVSYVAMYKGRKWDYRSCGETHRNPTWTLGMLNAFSTKIAWDINDPE